MKAFVVDDEKHVVKTMSLLLGKINGVELIGTAYSVQDAIKNIPSSGAEILFLDVELQDGLSFDILSQLDHKNYQIVFITAHSHYAMQAIRFSAFDYLLKPVHPKELEETCLRLINEKQHSLEKRISALEDNLRTKDSEAKIVLKTAEKYIIVNSGEIVNMEADNIYTSVFLKDGRRIVVSKPMKNFEEMLSEKGFYRSHRSHLVKISEIKEYVKTSGGYLVMSNGKQIPVSSGKINDILSRL